MRAAEGSLERGYQDMAVVRLGRAAKAAHLGFGLGTGEPWEDLELGRGAGRSDLGGGILVWWLCGGRMRAGWDAKECKAGAEPVPWV